LNRFRKVKDDAELTQVELVYGQPQILGLLKIIKGCALDYL
jgi:hypothetical protein